MGLTILLDVLLFEPDAEKSACPAQDGLVGVILVRTNDVNSFTFWLISLPLFRSDCLRTRVIPTFDFIPLRFGNKGDAEMLRDENSSRGRHVQTGEV